MRMGVRPAFMAVACACAPFIAAPLAATPFIGAAATAAAQGVAARVTQARTVVIYRCTDAAGHVTIQNDVPCPKGSKQQRQAVDVPAALPAHAPAEAPEAADAPDASTARHPAETQADATAAPAPAPAPAPPPQLYACRTWDGRDLLTEDATPAERCAPLQVVASDGTTRSDAAACETVHDQCEAVPADALCQAWHQRVDEAEFRWKFAGAKQDDARHAEFESLAATLARSDCAAH